MDTIRDLPLISNALIELNQSVKEVAIGLKDVVTILAKKRQVRKVHLTGKPDIVPWGSWVWTWDKGEYRNLWRVLNGRGTHRPVPKSNWVMLHDLVMKNKRNRNYWSTSADGRVVKYYNGTTVLKGL